jgi:acylpyruvate hydrolase
MRLATVSVNGGTAAAVLTEDGLAEIDGFADVGALLRDGGLDAARAAAANGGSRLFSPGELLRPVLEPKVIVCVGLNYRDHILEMGRELPEHPTLFAKLPGALTDPVADIVIPSSSVEVDYEGELVIVIGQRVRNATPAEAEAAIAGYTLMNDVSMRDFQYRTLQWFAGKNFERSTPVGPYVATADEVGDLAGRELRVAVNGDLRQHARFGELVFDPPALVADISQILTLDPVDLIATGTPGGVGYGMEPKLFLQDGDVVEISVAGIGALRNCFVAA